MVEDAGYPRYARWVSQRRAQFELSWATTTRILRETAAELCVWEAWVRGSGDKQGQRGDAI